MDDDARFRDIARRLGAAVEPLAAALYFSPQAQARYETLGLNYFEGYFCSRSAPLGALPWRGVAAVFAAFQPGVVERAVTGGWAKTTPEDLMAAREAGSREQYAAQLGEPTDDMARAADLLLGMTEGVDASGRPLFAGLAGLPVPDRDDPFVRLWRAADLVREFRGDGHISAWVPWFDSVEISTISEPWWGIPLDSYVWTRGYGPDEVAAARDRLRGRGLLDEDGNITEAGREARERVEVVTDEATLPLVRRLGDDADELFALLAPIGEAMTGPGAYPANRSNLFGS
jgi:hypothetical protein